MGVGPEPDETAITLPLLERLRPYLAESLMVLDRDWTVRVNFAPPGGLIGQGLGIGEHTLEHMHPDDAVAIMDLGAQVFEIGHGWQGSKIVRMRTGNGEYAKYEVMAVNLFDDPVVQGLVVRTREAPSERGDQLDGLDTSSTLESVAELIPSGLILLDPHAHIVFANHAACRLFDLDKSHLKHAGVTSLIDPGDRPEIVQILERFTTSHGEHECVVRLATTPAKLARCRFSAEGTREVTRVVLTLDDVTESHAEQLHLQHQASHDDLTGLRNRASMLDLIRKCLDRHDPVALAYLDLDGFKAINDTWGHDRGDQVLVAVAGALKAGVPATMEIARIGGDEFVVLWDGTGDMHAVVERLRQLVDDVASVEGFAFTASIGTSLGERGDSPRDLLRRADLSMYAEKAARGRVGDPSSADEGSVAE